jgi:hypothetical protein
MEATMIVETSQFRAKPGVSDAQLLAASQLAYEGFLSRCKGLVGRELLKADDGTWFDIVRFETMTDATAAMEGFLGRSSTKAFEDAIDPATVQMRHFEVVRKYEPKPAAARREAGAPRTQPETAERGPGSASADVGMTSDGDI